MKTQSPSRSRMRTLLKGASAFVMTAIAFAALPALPVSAAEYNLTIAGVKVTDLNKNDILEDGAFSYNASSKTLTIKEDSSYNLGPMVESHIDGLTILIDSDDVDLYGDASYNIFQLEGSTKIAGGAGESCMWLSSSKNGIYIYNGNLTIENLDLLSINTGNTSTGNAISGGGEKEKLIVKNSYVRATTEASQNAIANFTGGISFEDCGLDTDYQVKNGAVCYSEEQGGGIAENIRIYLRAMEIAGVRVTKANRSDILGNGVFSFDPAANELKIKGNYTYEPSGGAAKYFIDTNYPNLTVNVTADSKLTDNRSGFGMNFSGDTTFTGKGKLEYTYPICTSDSAKLTFKDANVKVYVKAPNSFNNAVFCDGDLAVENSILDFTNEGKSAIYVDGGASGLAPTDGMIINSGGSFNGINVVNDDGTVMDHARIVPKYNVSVLSKYVDYDSKDDILGNGALSYDPAANVLNIKGDITRDTVCGYFIDSQIPDLTVRISGSRTWAIPCNTLFFFRENAAITGGSLAWSHVDSPNQSAIILDSNVKELTLKDTKLNLSSRYDTIHASNYHSKLLIDGADLSLHSRYDYAIANFNDGIELSNCKFTDPVTAFVDGGTVWENSMKRDVVKDLVVSALTKITKQPVNITGKVGDNAKFSVNATGQGTISYQWQFLDNGYWKNSGMTGAKTATLTVPITAARDGQKYRCVVTCGGTSVESDPAALKVQAAITAQPTTQMVTAGSTAKFTVAASGAGTLTYQWQFFTGNAWQNSGMTGANTASLSVQATDARDGQQYRCIVTSSNGTYVISNAVSIKLKPTITKQPATYTGQIGDTAKFTVTATGKGSLTYQWQFYTGNYWQSSGMTGANTATLSVPVTAERVGQQYRCIVTSSNGASVISDAASIKLNLAITSQPTTQTLPIGSTAKFTVVAAGNSLTYQWQFLSGSAWKNSGMTGANTATLSVPVTAERDGQQYRCIVKSGSTSVTSGTASIKVKTAITKQPTNQSGTIDSTVKFTVTASGKNLTYQWQFLSTSGWQNSGMTGAKTATLSVPVTAAREGQQYKCVVKSANGTSATSNAVKLMVAPKITAQPQNVTGTVGSTAKFTVGATGVNLAYYWQFLDNGVWKDSGMTGAKTATLSVPITAARNGQQYRCLVKCSNGLIVYTNAVTLKVSSGITAQPQNFTGKVGQTAKFTVSVSGSNISYQWQFLSNAGWKDSGMTGAKTATISVPITAERDGQKYRCVVKVNGTTVTSNEAALKVQAAITAQPQNVTGAVGSTAKFTVTASGANLTYQWQFLSNTGWKDSGMTGAKTATISVPVTAERNGQQYRCIVKSANGTSVTSNAAKLTVK